MHDFTYAVHDFGGGPGGATVPQNVPHSAAAFSGVLRFPPANT